MEFNVKVDELLEAEIREDGFSFSALKFSVKTLQTIRTRSGRVH